MTPLPGKGGSVPDYVPLRIREAGPEAVAAWHDPLPLLAERDALAAALAAAVQSVPLVSWVRDIGWIHPPSSDFDGCTE